MSGGRLSEEEYKEKAEENIKSALGSSFSVKERLEFFKDKWRKEHRGELVFWIVVLVGVFVLGALVRFVWGSELGLAVCGGDCIGAAVVRVVRYNRMMAYAEGKAFDGKGDN